MMKEKIKLFLDTDLLERYLLETTSTDETSQVERYIAMHPEVRDAYNELQENLEVYAKMHAIRTPEGLKEQILGNLRQEKRSRSKFSSFAIAASVATLIFASASFFFYGQNKDLQEENAVVSNKIINLEKHMKLQLEDIRNQYIVLNNPNTKKYAVKGNKKAKELKAVAYINPVKKLSYINVSNLTATARRQMFSNVGRGKWRNG